MLRKGLIIAVIAIGVSSCGRSGWSCKNRYCQTPDGTPYQEVSQKTKVSE
ncbi:hypothetical protein [Flavobacterium sp.]